MAAGSRRARDASPSRAGARAGAWVRDGRANGFGLTAWLMVLVLVPMTMVAVLAGAAVVRAQSTVSDAKDVESDVAGLTRLVAVRDAMLDLQSLQSFDLRFEELHYSRA